MATPQPAIFAQGSTRSQFLQFRMTRELVDDRTRAAMKSLLDPAPAPLGTHATPPHVLVAFGTGYWALLAHDAPDGFRPFTPLGIAGGPQAPRTPGDILVWLHGTDEAALFDKARDVTDKLDGIAALELDQPCFVYHDSRDLTGFIDGSANPTGDKALAAALIGEGPNAGGSFVLTQKWRHDLHEFQALPVPEQEKVFGRTKLDSVEFEGDAMPPRAHVARTDFKKDGVAMKILRRSAPWGTPTEAGLMFLAFSCSIERFDVLLGRMFDEKEPDRLLEFSTALTGNYWYAPTLEQIAALGS